MSERLFIRLGTHHEQACSWLVWSEQEQEIIASGELSDAASLTNLKDRVGNRPVDILVPTASMMLTDIRLPEKGQRQALKALPFLMEESLATSIEDMHFVVGPRSGEKLSVIAVAHQQMQDWLTWLNDAGLKAKRLVPDCLALPLAGSDWAAMRCGDELIIRTGQGTGVSLPQAWQSFALPKLMASQDPKSETINLASYSENLEFAGANVEHKQLDLPMLVFAKGILNAPVNLLSGVYKPKREYSKQLLLWKNSAIICVLAIVLALVNKGLDIRQLNQATMELNQQSESIFKSVSPGTQRVVNIHSQMGAMLKSMQGHGGGVAFFEMLSGLQTAFKQIPDLKPNSLRFDANRNEIRMQITANSYGQIEQFKELVSKDFEIDTGAMNSNEDKVTSTVTVRSK
ncbi:type II secretion system protein GspL [Shewanella sp.]|uniref:type II secretion system protein GspL n=1 Tax=Shewanella sp. TaxID=50422 RepID=UPI00405466A4